jgi:integrase
MSSIVNRPQGHKWLQFKAPNGKRQTLRLGKISAKQARDFQYRVDGLLAAKAMGHAPDIETAKWVGSLSPKIHARLAKAGLASGMVPHTLKELIAEFKKSLKVEPATTRNIAIACKNLLTHFGPTVLIASITPGDAKEFRAVIATTGREDGGPLAVATVSRRCRRAKQVFAYAVDKRWLAANPFAQMKGWSEVNRSKDFYVTLDLVQSVLAEIPNLEFHTIVVLARFGGLRSPSEILPMRWDQVNWEHETLLIKSPKTKRYEGRDQRTVPLFPEIRDALEELWEEAPDGEPLLFPGHQITGAGLSSELQRTCRAAGIALWPRPWQNLRATRETELLEEFPIHAVAQWLGHSPAVAIQHYAQIVKEHQARAVKMRKSVLQPPGPSPKRSKNRSTVSSRSVTPRDATEPKTPKNTESSSVSSRIVPERLPDEGPN